MHICIRKCSLHLSLFRSCLYGQDIAFPEHLEYNFGFQKVTFHPDRALLATRIAAGNVGFIEMSLQGLLLKRQFINIKNKYT